MTSPLSRSLLNELREYLRESFGLDFQEKMENDLIRYTMLAAKGFGYSDTSQFIQQLIKNKHYPTEPGKLASYYTIGETYFMREKKSLDFIEYYYLPPLIQKRFDKCRNLRIWSAGCASGEEVYSIAIMLSRTIPDIQNWDITLLGTDINTEFLKKAQQGIYSKWSFRNCTESFRDRYFERVNGNEYHIRPELKKMVRFSYHNLVGGSLPGVDDKKAGMDVIFCRNVMIYFSRETIRNVSERLFDSLVNGGILVVSPVEMSTLISPRFNKIFYSGYTFYQKEKKKQRTKKETVENEFQTVTPPPVIAPPGGSGQEENDPLPDIQPVTEKNPFLLAKAAADSGSLNDAIRYCDEALKLNKTDYRIYYLKATVLLELGREEEAMSTLNQLVYLEQDFVLAYFLLGNINMRSGKISEGHKHYKHALKILSKLKPEEELPGSEGLTIGRLAEIINGIGV
ncbi:MAG: tetratricopeptide repeat protein [Bacteroidetes bacterium]|nr:tetratricopeptide repeat protein [Bacteroidota bacterium]